jgi:chromosome segregation ATPase
MMERKTKFIIVGLAGIFIIGLFFNLRIYSAKQLLERERDELKKENASLVTKIEEINAESQRFKNRINALNRDLDNIAKEKEEIQAKYDAVFKERDDLVEKLKGRPVQVLEVKEKPSLSPTDDAYWAGVLKAKTDLELQLETIRTELKTAQIKSEEFQREKSSLELDINNLIRDKKDLEQQLEYNKKMIDSISQELVREKNDKLQIQESLKAVKNENASLRQELKGLSSRKARLEEKLQQLEKDKASLERAFTEMEIMLKDKINKVCEFKEQLDATFGKEITEAPEEKKEAVELPPIVVHPEAEATLPAKPEIGKVLAVNRDNNFVIINLGENSGIRLGDTFQVYKEGKAIASIEVVQLRKNIAACDIKRQATSVSVGDTIK